MKIRKAILWLHRWLGLISGIVVLIVAVTGCLFAFQKEISEAVWKDLFFVEPRTGTELPVSDLLARAQAALGPGQPVRSITAYADPGRAWEFMTYRENDSALTYFGALEYFRSAFVDPHTGRVTGVHDYRTDFFSIVKYIHWSLLLKESIGQPIVGWSTLVFVVLLITGLVLWWPKKWSRATRKQSFLIRWKASYKRVNYDLHNVPGFYALVVALILGLTGMMFAFRWFENLAYAAFAGTTQPPPVRVDSSRAGPGPVSPIDVAFADARQSFPGAQRIGINPARDSAATIDFYGYAGREVYYDYDEIRYDRYTARKLNRYNFKDKNRGEKLVYMNYDIHVGAIWGLPGKILAFLGSLVAASLPVTGFLIWYWKKNPRKKPVPVRRTAVVAA